MTLRLVLVSLVAALGLTIPGTPMIESWVASTQNWMNARFADWDTRNPPSTDYVIVSDYYDAELLACRSAKAQIPAQPAAPTAIEVRQTSIASPGPYLIVAAQPAAAHDSPGASTRPISFVRKSTVFQPLEVMDTLHRGIAFELNCRSEGLDLRIPRVLSRMVFRPRFEPLVVAATPLRTVADELNARNEGIGVIPPKVAPRQPVGRRFEPITVGDDYYVGVAFELNRRAEGIVIRPPVIAIASKPAVVVAEAKRPVVVAAFKPPVYGGPRFDALGTSPNLYFAGDLTLPSSTMAAAKPAPDKAAAVTVSKPVVVEVKRSPAKPAAATPGLAIVSRHAPAPDSAEHNGLEDLDIEIAGALAPSNDGFGVWTVQTKPAPRSAGVPTVGRRTEPLPVSDQIFGAMALEIHRRFDGFRLPTAPPSPTPSPKLASGPRPSRALSQAVSLTREAVYAWVNVFTGPAIVTVSHSQ
jgi:hypothetical protein